MKPVTIINSKQFHLTLTRLCFQLIENHNSFEHSVIIGLQPRGIYLAHRMSKMLEEIKGLPITSGALDITFYRDDFRQREKPLIPSATNVDFIVEGKKVILMDDVLYTGRTVRAGLDAMLAFGRPSSVELLVLIDRRLSRNLPIQPNYVGKTVDSISEERVSVEWKETEGEDNVILFTPKDDR